MSDQVNFQEHNVRGVITYFTKLPMAMRAGSRNALETAGTLLQMHCVAQIDKSPKAYKRYYYPGIGFTRSSYPGNFPANQSENLASSMTYTILSPSLMLFGSTADYAKWLEDGTKKMGARPFLKRTIDNCEFHIIQTIKCAVSAEMKL